MTNDRAQIHAGLVQNFSILLPLTPKQSYPYSRNFRQRRHWTILTLGKDIVLMWKDTVLMQLTSLMIT